MFRVPSTNELESQRGKSQREQQRYIQSLSIGNYDYDALNELELATVLLRDQKMKETLRKLIETRRDHYGYNNCHVEYS